MVKGVIFDFNGTLFFDNDKHVKAWGAISRLLRNKDITDEELHKHFNGVPNQKIIQYMKNNQATKEDIDYTIDNLKEIVAHLRSMSPLYEDFMKKQK